jgi:hypothetical protein
LREGEGSLSDLWIEFHHKKISLELGGADEDTIKKKVEVDHPVPQEIDFRMR